MEKNRAFAEKYDFPFKLLCDTDRSMGVAYGASDGSEGSFANRISYLIGADGRIAAVWDTVNVKTHADDVLGAL